MRLSKTGACTSETACSHLKVKSLTKLSPRRGNRCPSYYFFTSLCLP